MPPIRVGFIGLPGTPPGQYQGTNWAANAHLPFLSKSPHYQIVALLNTSAESARRAISRFGLPAETKAYGNPQDLANDPNVDLVVCCTRVDRHFDPVRPSLEAGKDVYVEWPLERNLEMAREMAALARKYKVRTAVGLQASFEPVVRRLKSLVQGGAIGRVLSSDFHVAAGNDLFSEGKNIAYFLERSVGGGPINIYAAHNLESITAVLGPFKTFNSGASISRPFLAIVDSDAETVLKKDITNECPDQILMFGIVGPSNALVTLRIQCGDQFPGLPQADWRIQGDKGSIRVTATTLFLGMGAEDVKVQVYDRATGRLWEETMDEDDFSSLPLVARNIGRLYEAFRNKEWVPDFDWAVQRHELVDQTWRQFDEARS